MELLEQKFKTYFIKDADEIQADLSINSFDIHQNVLSKQNHFLPTQKELKIVLTSGASCPDSIVEGVMKRLLSLRYSEDEVTALCEQFA